jgi:hypothetical protein
MAIALAISGVAFAAICMWLTVRIINRKERWAKWMAVAVAGVPVLYVASIGPAYWLIAAACIKKDSVQWAYRPLLRIRPAKHLIIWYVELGACEVKQDGRFAPRRADVSPGGYDLDWHTVEREWH